MSFIINPFIYRSNAPYIFIGSASIAANGSDVTTSAIDTTGANLLVVVIAYYENYVATLSDSYGNTFTALTAQYGSIGGGGTTMFYCSLPVTGASHTFTATGGFYPGLCVAAFAGANASPFDSENGNASGGGAVGTIQPGSVTPSQDNELIITGLGTDFRPADSIDSGFIIAENAWAGVVGTALAYKIQTSANSENPTWTISLPAYGSSTSIACFKS